MKGAEKLSNAMRNTLTEQEKTEIKEVIRKIADNHKKDKWWKVDCAVRTYLNCVLYELRMHDECMEDIAKIEIEEDEECLDL